MPRPPDFGAMMGLSDLGPRQEDFTEEEMGAALFGREQFVDNPQIHRDYSGDNPYGEGAHGAWLDDSGAFYEGLGAMREDEADANAGLDIPIEDDEGDMEALDDEAEMMLDEEMALAEDSDEYQAR